MEFKLGLKYDEKFVLWKYLDILGKLYIFGEFCVDLWNDSYFYWDSLVEGNIYICL